MIINQTLKEKKEVEEKIKVTDLLFLFIITSNL